ncbi:hypothetical protein [Coleofasciculus sp. FACHB-1120]|nr:hypothetical protein [Coleofasciculus sp. FACHB-1120]
MVQMILWEVVRNAIAFFPHLLVYPTTASIRCDEIMWGVLCDRLE